MPSANATHFDKQVIISYVFCGSSHKLCQHKQTCCVSSICPLCEDLLTFSAVDQPFYRGLFSGSNQEIKRDLSVSWNFNLMNF